MKKKKLVLGLLTVMLACGTTLKTFADGESGESGGAPLGTCKPPMTNICFKIYQNGKLVGQTNGVLNV